MNAPAHGGALPEQRRALRGEVEIVDVDESGNPHVWKLVHVVDERIWMPALEHAERCGLEHPAARAPGSVGDSPHEYIIRRRMERAQGLMLSTDKALSEIAAECGMADQAHFTRLFRRFVGESPGAWRRARADPRS